ncbi:hypothetical protein NC651_007444 [Populus alba x Populus x berolinensis]|nr:hypothetical protein NC651_007444 [Populus alba x Populus x berolinensis]
MSLPSDLGQSIANFPETSVPSKQNVAESPKLTQDPAGRYNHIFAQTLSDGNYYARQINHQLRLNISRLPVKNGCQFLDLLSLLFDQEEVDVVHPLDKEKGITLEDFKLIKMHMGCCYCSYIYEAFVYQKEYVRI